MLEFFGDPLEFKVGVIDPPMRRFPSGHSSWSAIQVSRIRRSTSGGLPVFRTRSRRF